MRLNNFFSMDKHSSFFVPSFCDEEIKFWNIWGAAVAERLSEIKITSGPRFHPQHGQFFVIFFVTWLSVKSLDKLRQAVERKVFLHDVVRLLSRIDDQHVNSLLIEAEASRQADLGSRLYNFFIRSWRRGYVFSRGQCYKTFLSITYGFS